MWIFGAMQEYVGRLPKPAPRSNSQHSIKTRKLEKKKAERVTKMKNTKRYYINVTRAGSLNNFSGEPDRGEPNFSQSQRCIS